jgi:hypothetical protein
VLCYMDRKIQDLQYVMMKTNFFMMDHIFKKISSLLCIVPMENFEGHDKSQNTKTLEVVKRHFFSKFSMSFCIAWKQVFI